VNTLLRSVEESSAYHNRRDRVRQLQHRMNRMFWFVGVEGEGEQHHCRHDQAEEEKDGARSAICFISD